MATSVLGQDIALPVIISPTGVQAVHPDGEVAVVRAAAARGTVMGLSNFASKSVEEVMAANPATLFQMYWTGDRDTMIREVDPGRPAGVSTGGFPRAASRTRRARFRATGAPQAPSWVVWFLIPRPATESGSLLPGIGSAWCASSPG